MSTRHSKLLSFLIIVSFVLSPISGYSLPQGEQVVAGGAVFDRSQADTLNITQSTNKLIANYDSFSIAQPEAVHFYQPSATSIALNRVVGVDPSSIMGTLTATGRIFLVNPNGVVFGSNAVVDTAGLVASTLNISNDDFLAGRYTFFGQGGSVVNQGYISAPGGFVALLGSTVENTGLIEAELGSIALASGDAVTLNLDPVGLISVVIDDPTSLNPEGKNAAVDNSGTLSANGGKVVLTAQTLDGIFDKAINTNGIIEANALDGSSGEIILEANQRVNVAGDISAIGGKVTGDVQGADFSGSITADEALFDMNDGDTDIYDVTLTGNYNIHDNITINVYGTVDITDGCLYLVADDNHDHVGDLNIDGGSLLLNGSSIALWGNNIYVNDATIANTDTTSKDARITLKAGFSYNDDYDFGDIDIIDSTIFAHAEGAAGTGSDYNTASIGIIGENVTITRSDLRAETFSSGNAQIDVKAGDGEYDDFDGGTITITDSNLITNAEGGDAYTDSQIRFYSQDLIASTTEGRQEISALVSGHGGDAGVVMRCGDYTSVSDSQSEEGYSEYTTVETLENGTVSLTNTDVLARVYGNENKVSEATIDVDTGSFSMDNSTMTAEIMQGSLPGTSQYSQDLAEIEITAADTYNRNISTKGYYLEDPEWDSRYEYTETETWSGGSILVTNKSSILTTLEHSSDDGSQSNIFMGAADITIGETGEGSEQANLVRSVILGNGDTMVSINAGEAVETEEGWEYARYLGEGETLYYGEYTEIDDMTGGDFSLLGQSRIISAAGYGSFRNDADIEIVAGNLMVNSQPIMSSPAISGFIRGDGSTDVWLAAADTVHQEYTEQYNDLTSEYYDTETMTASGGLMQIIDSVIHAQVNYPLNFTEIPHAHIRLEAAGTAESQPIYVSGSTLHAEVMGDGSTGEAGVEIDAWSGDTLIEESVLEAWIIAGLDTAAISINSGGNLELINSLLNAYVMNDGNAYIDLDAGEENGGELKFTTSKALAEIGNDGNAVISLKGEDAVNIAASKAMMGGNGIKSLVNGDGNAEVNISTNVESETPGQVTILTSDITTDVNGAGRSAIDIKTQENDSYGGTVAIWMNSELTARHGSGTSASSDPALISIDAGDIEIITSYLSTLTDNGDGAAFIEMATSGDISIESGSILSASTPFNSLKTGLWLTGGGSLLVSESMLFADSAYNTDHANYIHSNMGRDILATNSLFSVYTDGDGTSAIDLNAGGSFAGSNAELVSDSGNGTSSVSINVAEDIALNDGTKLSAICGSSNVVNLTAETGNITGENQTDPTIDAGSAALNAGKTIGTEENPILTRINNLSATAENGDIHIINYDTLVINEANALGSVIDIENHGDTVINSMRAEGSGSEDPAEIYVNVFDGDLCINGLIEAVNPTGFSETELAVWNGFISAAPDSLISSDYLVMLAAGEIGSFDYPVNTAVDNLSTWTTGEYDSRGNVYINELDDIALGFTDQAYGDQADLVGYSVGSRYGIVHVISGGDMIVNSVLAPYNGVFLQSTNGSIYAGTGWCPMFDVYSSDNIMAFKMALCEALDISPSDPDFPDFFSALDLFLTDVYWASIYEGPDRFCSPLMPLKNEEMGDVNLVAGGFSYLSTPNGTIGVGTPAAQTADVSGGIEGFVRWGIEAATGEYPAPGIDTSRFEPPSQISYFDTEDICGGLCFDDAREEGYQIWPAAPVGAPVFDNPLTALVVLNEGTTTDALPQWFLDSLPDNNGNGYYWPEGVSALTLEIGQSTQPPAPTGDGAVYNVPPRDFRAYYELLANYRVFFADPALPTEFYAYHPLTPTDSAAFDDIELDEEAYDFIAGSVEYKKKIAPYYE